MSLSLFVRKVVVCLAVASAGAVFSEEITPQGGEYAIVGALIGDQSNPTAGLAAGGGYLAWQDNAASTYGLRIRAVRLDSAFRMTGVPFTVSSAANSKTAGDQEKAQLAVFPGGGAVFVWQGGKPGFEQIYARFLGPAGTFLTSDIRVSKFPKNNQINPCVTVLTDGSVVIVWSSYGQDGSRFGVFAQQFTAAGGRIGTEFQVNQWTLNNQRTPAVAALANGNYVISWLSELQPGAIGSHVADVYARIFSPTGAVTGELIVNSSSSNICANPTLAGAADGGFAAGWSQNDNVPLLAGNSSGVWINPVTTVRSTNSWDVFARVFDAAGTPVSDAFRLNTYTFGDQYAPTVSASGTNYMAVWTSLGQDGSWEGVFGQAFGNDGGKIGSELRANTTTVSRQLQPTVAGDGVDRFLVVWSSFVVGGNFDFDLFARAYQLSE